MNNASLRLVRLKKKLVDRSRPRHANVSGRVAAAAEPEGDAEL